MNNSENIKIEIIGGATQKTVLELENLFKQILTSMNTDTSIIEKIHITPPEKYNETIKLIDPNEGCSDNRMAVGIAKTIPHYNGKSTVILKASDIRNHFQLSKNPKYLNLNLYAVYHEFGHCIDNNKRNIQKLSISKEQVLKQFKIGMLRDYNCYILEGEFAACVHSSLCVSNEVFNDFIKNLNLYHRKFSILMKENMEKYFKDNQYLYNFAFNAANVIWLLMIEFGKLIGTQFGNDVKLKNIKIIEELNFSIGAIDILKKYKSYLISSWKFYPSWPNDFRENLMIFWKKLALIYGFNFEEHGGVSDAMFFDVDVVNNFSQENLTLS